MHTPAQHSPSKPARKNTGVVRTSISLSRKVKSDGDSLVAEEGFNSFSDLVEYLIRRRIESEHPLKAA